jgi:hypothetical protein
MFRIGNAPSWSSSPASADEHPALGRHLRTAVRTGTMCVYAPPVRVDWDT